MTWHERISTLAGLLALLPAQMSAQVLWDPEQQLTTNQYWSYVGYNNARCVATWGSEVHVLWADNRYQVSTSEILYRRSTDNGTTWEPFVRLSNDPANSDYPSLAVSESMVHAVWQDDRDGNSEVYYARSFDGGASWGQDANLSNDPDESYSPFVALSGSRVHVIWQDGRNPGPYNHHIYYRRGITVMIFADGFESGTTARWSATAGS